MTDLVPPGYRLYTDVVTRLLPVRPAGNGLTFRCLFPERHKNGDRNPSGRAWIGKDGALLARCMGCGATWQEIVDATGTHVCDWWPNKGQRMERPTNHPKPVLVATHEYRDRDGELLYQKLRYEPGYDGRSKTFIFRRPLPQEWRSCNGVPDGVEAWAWGMLDGEYSKVPGKAWDFRRPVVPGQPNVMLSPITPVLYRMPDVLATRADWPVLVVEGEKDADLLWELGMPATCGHAGSNTWLREWTADLAGRRVVIVPDCDYVGREHAEKVAGACLLAGCPSVRVVQWDGVGQFFPGDGGGIGNWLANETGDMKAAVVALVKRSREYILREAAA